MKLKFLNKKELTDEQKKKRFYRKLKVKKNSSDEIIRDRIYSYLSSGKDLDKVYLTEEQLNDPVFMSIVYNTRPEILNYYKPNKALQENFMFMKVFIRNMISHLDVSKGKLQEQLTKTLSCCRHALKNIDVVKYITEVNNQFSGLLLVRDVFLKNVVIDEEEYKAYLKIVAELPKESYLKEIKYKNGQILSIIESKHPLYKELADEAAREFGLKAVKHIDKSYLMENPELVYTAAKVDSVNGLYRYLTVDLKERPFDIIEVRQDKKQLRKILVRNEKINELLQDEFYISNGMIDELYC